MKGWRPHRNSKLETENSKLDRLVTSPLSTAGMGDRRVGLIVAAVVVAVLALVWLVGQRLEREEEISRAVVKPPRAAGDGAPREVPLQAELPPPAREEAAPAPEAAEEGGAEDAEADASAAAWAAVDLEAVRRAMPDNIYFKLAAPTKDEEVIAAREAERARWNVEYGKVLSGTGTDEEIRAYFDDRARVSTDYVEFVTYVLDHHREELPERDVTLLELARRLHLARLEEIPRKIQEAFERKRLQDEARAAWLADEEEFNREQER